jgi:hypothetical protein
MEVNECLNALESMYKDREWFHSVGVDNIGRSVVYIKFNCKETIFDIPDEVCGKQVLVHSAGSKTATREQYTNVKEPSLVLVPKVEEEIVDVTEYAMQDLDDLVKELDRLEKLCGTHVLQDIFYETHDGKNALTFLSERFPEVRASMDKLYETYGFDVIYDEL